MTGVKRAEEISPTFFQSTDAADVSSVLMTPSLIVLTPSPGVDLAPRGTPPFVGDVLPGGLAGVDGGDHSVTRTLSLIRQRCRRSRRIDNSQPRSGSRASSTARSAGP